MVRLRSFALSSALALSFSFAPCVVAQQNIAPKSDTGTATAAHYTHDQLLTSTVHQAWELSGKNEANFFEMVAQLADISANNRGITLPDTEAAGRRMGEYIKRTAKADTDQLLYAVVDKAVLMTSKTAVHPAGKPRTSGN